MSSQKAFLQRLKSAIRSLSPHAISRILADCGGPSERQRRLERALELPVTKRPARNQATDEYDGRSLVLEAVWRALEFGASGGFSYREIGAFLELFVTCLEIVQEPDCDLMSALQSFQCELTRYSITRLSAAILVSASGYMVETVFQHLRLYQFLLSQPQAVALTSLQLSVETPTPPQPLVEGVTAAEWERDRERKALREKHEAALEELVKECTQEEERGALKLQQTYDEQLDGFKSSSAKRSDLTEEEVSRVIDALAQAHVDAAQSTLSLQLKRNELKLTQVVEQLQVLSPWKLDHTAEGGKASSSQGKGGRKSRATPVGKSQ